MVRTSLQLQPHGIAPESIKDTFAVTEQPQQSLKPPSCSHTKNTGRCAKHTWRAIRRH
jgi:hypothetical protein